MSRSKKSHKKIIGIIIAIIIFAIATFSILFFVVPRSKAQKVAFNEYANYLLYGKESTAKIENHIDLSYVYYFDKQNINLTKDDTEKDGIIQYYNILSEKLANFISNNKKETETIREYTNTANAYFEVRKTYLLTDEIIRNYFVQNGYSATSSLIKKHYLSLLNSDSEYITIMYNHLLKLAEHYLSKFNTYYAAGCTNGVEINYDCPSVDTNSYSVIELELENAVDTVLSEMRRKTLEGCWDIYETEI